MTPLLRFERVTCRRGGRILFEDLDLELRAGESLHLSGPNGSGKSSLIRLAAGLLQPDSGRVNRGKVALADEGNEIARDLRIYFTGAAQGLSAGAVEHFHVVIANGASRVRFEEGDLFA